MTGLTPPLPLVVTTLLLARSATYGTRSDVRHIPCGPVMSLAAVWIKPSGVTIRRVPELLSTIQIVPSDPTANPVGR